jgi:hypothetical protein
MLPPGTNPIAVNEYMIYKLCFVQTFSCGVCRLLKINGYFLFVAFDGLIFVMEVLFVFSLVRTDF